MTDWNSTDEVSMMVRAKTHALLEAIATVRGDDVRDVLDELIEAGRAKLAPKPKAASPTRGRKPKDPS